MAVIASEIPVGCSRMFLLVPYVRERYLYYRARQVCIFGMAIQSRHMQGPQELKYTIYVLHRGKAALQNVQ